MFWIFIFLWFFIGCIIAVPYSYLAGNDPESIMGFIKTAWISPIGAIIVFIVFSLSQYKTAIRNTILALMYFCLPIILNGLSKIAGLLGYEYWEKLIFDMRYPMLSYVALFIVLFFILFYYIKGKIKRKKQKRWREREKKV